MKLTSSKLLAADLRPSELDIFDDKIVFRSNIGVIGGEEAIVNYDQVAEVTQRKGLLQSSLDIDNEGGADDITIEHVPNDQASQAKELIEKKAYEAHQQIAGTFSPENSVDQIAKLAELHAKGELTEQEFETEKNKLIQGPG